MDPALLLEIINGKEVHKVEEVRDHRKQEHNMQFLIHWREYGNEHDQ